MAVLTINGKEFEGKCNFKFDRVANEKYNAKNDQGEEIGGFSSIYTGLMSYDTSKLLAFWDCALAHHLKEKPSQDAIEDALMERIDAEGTEPLFKEAFNTVDESGFYKLQVKNFWKGFENLKEAGKTAEEKKKFGLIYKTMTEAKATLKA